LPTGREKKKRERERERESFHFRKEKKKSDVEIPHQVVKKCCGSLGVSIVFSIFSP
jgi:hypothetical protein